MKERHIDTLTLVDSLEAGDLLVVEENSELKQADISLLANLASYDEGLTALPQVYTGLSFKGGISTYTRDGVFKAVSSMISAAYDGVTVGNKLRLFILESFGALFKAADWSVSGSIVTADFVDSTSVTFTEGDLSVYQAFVVSPWGQVPSTDGFAEAAPLWSADNSLIPAVFGTIELGTLDPAVVYPFAALYKDPYNYIKLYVFGGSIWAELMADGIPRKGSTVLPASPFTFSASIDIVTGASSAVFEGTTVTLMTAEGEAFGYELGGDTHVFGTTVGLDTYVFGRVLVLSDNLGTIYIGKDFTGTFLFA